MDLVPLSHRLGAEVRGLDLHGDIGGADIDELRAALDRHKLVLVRGQEVDDLGHLQFCELFGFSVANRPEDGPRTVSNRRPGGHVPFLFHTDHLYTPGGPSPALSLYALEVPEGGTSTSFADTELAYETLPDALRDRVERLQQRIVFSWGEYEPIRSDDNPQAPEGFFATHPVVMIHPRTGAKLLCVSDIHTARIEGVSDDDSLTLIDELCAHIAKPEHCYEHQWQLHDLIVWDNIALHHARGANDLSVGARTLRRVVLDTRSLAELTPPSVLRAG